MFTESHLLFQWSVVNRFKCSRPWVCTNQTPTEQYWLNRKVVDLGAWTCKEQRPLLCPLDYEAEGVQESFSLCPKPVLMGICVSCLFSLSAVCSSLETEENALFQCFSLPPSVVSKIRAKFSSQLFSKKGNCLQSLFVLLLLSKKDNQTDCKYFSPIHLI